MLAAAGPEAKRIRVAPLDVTIGLGTVLVDVFHPDGEVLRFAPSFFGSGGSGLAAFSADLGVASVEGRVRRAFAMAVDWRRIGQLASTGGDPKADVATSMVPPGIPGRSDEDFVPAHDPVAARALLAEAGFPGGAGFPAVTMVTNGGAYDAAILDEVRRELGITLGYETMEFAPYIDRLDNDPPAIWSSTRERCRPAPRLRWRRRPGRSKATCSATAT